MPPGPEPVAAASSRTLTPDEAAATGWRARYAALGPGLKVGVSWRGGASALDRRRRSIAPPDWAPLAALSGVHFVNLQHGVDGAETDAVEAALGSPLARWPDADGGTDFDDFVVRVDGLDLVVSATNTTVHVAGGAEPARLVSDPAGARLVLRTGGCRLPVVSERPAVAPGAGRALGRGARAHRPGAGRAGGGLSGARAAADPARIAARGKYCLPLPRRAGKFCPPRTAQGPA